MTSYGGISSSSVCPSTNSAVGAFSNTDLGIGERFSPLTVCVFLLTERLDAARVETLNESFEKD